MKLTVFFAGTTVLLFALLAASESKHAIQFNNLKARFNAFTAYNLDNGYEPIVGHPPDPDPPTGYRTFSSSPQRPDKENMRFELKEPIKEGDGARRIAYQWYTVEWAYDHDQNPDTDPAILLRKYTGSEIKPPKGAKTLDEGEISVDVKMTQRKVAKTTEMVLGAWLTQSDGTIEVASRRSFLSHWFYEKP